MHEVLGVVKTLFGAGVRYGHLGGAEVVDRDDRTDMQRPECKTPKGHVQGLLNDSVCLSVCLSVSLSLSPSLPPSSASHPHTHILKGKEGTDWDCRLLR